jgi:hypothetical protein
VGNGCGIAALLTQQPFAPQQGSGDLIDSFGQATPEFGYSMERGIETGDQNVQIKFHPDAAKRFDELATGIKGQVREV